MGEKENKPFQLSFNGLLKVDFQGSHVTSDGGLILVRELDERLGLGELIEEHLSDSRQGLNKKFPLADLLRQSVYSRLAGYEDLNDAVVACLTRQSPCLQEKGGSTMVESEFQIRNSGTCLPFFWLTSPFAVWHP